MLIAITGASGLLGRELAATLHGRGHKALAASHKSVARYPGGVEALALELTDPNSVREFVRVVSADWIVHAAAMTDVDGCERDPKTAQALNANATRLLAEAVAPTPTRIVYLSTDYVFDGQAGPYGETDQPKPINVYGRTKLDGELCVRKAGAHHVIVRTASLFGCGEPGRPTFIDTMLRQMRDKPPLLAADDQRSNITPVQYLADAIAEIIERGLDGLWHLAGQEIVSRYGLAVKLAALLELPSDCVRPVAYSELGRAALRPLNGGLKIDKALASLSVKPPTLDEALQRLRVSSCC